MSDVTKDLYKLVGNYEATTEHILLELQNINRKLDENTSEHTEIKQCLSDLEHISGSNRVKIKAFESNGVPKKTNQKIDAGLWLGILNSIVTIVKGLMGLP